MNRKQRENLVHYGILFVAWSVMVLVAWHSNRMVLSGHREYYFIAGVSFCSVFMLPVMLAMCGVLTLMEKWVEKGDKGD